MIFKFLTSMVEITDSNIMLKIAIFDWVLHSVLTNTLGDFFWKHVIQWGSLKALPDLNVSNFCDRIHSVGFLQGSIMIPIQSQIEGKQANYICVIWGMEINCNKINHGSVEGRKKMIQTWPQRPWASIVQVPKLVNNKHIFVVLKPVKYLMACWCLIYPAACVVVLFLSLMEDQSGSATSPFPCPN